MAEPNWQIVTQFLDQLRAMPELGEIGIARQYVALVRTLDFMDEGVELSDPEQLFGFVFGTMEPARMMMASYRAGNIPLYELRVALNPFLSVLSSLINYLPEQYFSKYYV